MNGLALFVAGLALLGGAAELVVRGASQLAASLGIKPLTVGLTVVAIGTSMPELAVGVTASWQGGGALVVANIAGANVFNILFINIFVILGLTCLVSPGEPPVERQLPLVDIPLMAGVALLCVPVFVTGKRVSRLEGGAFVALYMIYVFSLIFSRVCPSFEQPELFGKAHISPYHLPQLTSTVYETTPIEQFTRCINT